MGCVQVVQDPPFPPVPAGKVGNCQEEEATEEIPRPERCRRVRSPETFHALWCLVLSNKIIKLSNNLFTLFHLKIYLMHSRSHHTQQNN